ncbi:hypothetical protein FRB94_005654 [Tulasnella sp. JGI-2019a]|nr:hypothetical protein FRB94_005654 [Tulasnella sp. JGI-2019a]
MVSLLSLKEMAKFQPSSLVMAVRLSLLLVGSREDGHRFLDPMLLRNPNIKSDGHVPLIMESQGPRSPLAAFLKDFGPALLRKYNPKVIVVFSAHWETEEETLVTDYGDNNPLLYDYYGFEKELYQLTFNSHGDSSTSERVVDLLNKAGIKARTTPRLVERMVADSWVQDWITEYSPEKNWAIGKALDELRSQGILIISGGLTIHTFKDPSALSESTANAHIRGFHTAIIDAVHSPPELLKASFCALTTLPGFREANPRKEHFVPIYVAAGAGEGGAGKVISSQFGG